MADQSPPTLRSFFRKYPASNNWHPVPGGNRTTDAEIPLTALERTDLAATVVDIAPFIAGIAGIVHASQILDFGFTAPASIFRNVRTMTALHRSTLYLLPIVSICQATGIEYRNGIPRWAHDRELRRHESEVREHVKVGMSAGAAIWASRFVLGVGRKYWAPIEVVLGGALADMMHREYIRAHGL